MDWTKTPCTKKRWTKIGRTFSHLFSPSVLSTFLACQKMTSLAWHLGKNLSVVSHPVFLDFYRVKCLILCDYHCHRFYSRDDERNYQLILLECRPTFRPIYFRPMSFRPTSFCPKIFIQSISSNPNLT